MVLVALTQQQHKGTVTYIYQTKNYTEAEHLFCFFQNLGKDRFAFHKLIFSICLKAIKWLQEKFVLTQLIWFLDFTGGIMSFSDFNALCFVVKSKIDSTCVSREMDYRLESQQFIISDEEIRLILKNQSVGKMFYILQSTAHQLTIIW